MIIALLIAGILFFLAGALGIFLGIPVKEFSFGNTLILAGVVAGCTGMLTLGLAAVIRELKQIAERLESGAVAAAPSPQPVAAVAPRSQPVENSAFAANRNQGGPAADSAPPPWHEETAARERTRQEPPPAPAAEAARQRRNLMFSSSRKEGSGRAETRITDLSIDPRPGAPALPPAAKPADSPPPAFEGGWPQPERSRGAEAASQRRTGRTPSTFTEPAAGPSGTDRSAPAAREGDQPEVTVLKSGIVDGMAYSLYSDGSIEAQLPEGMMRFASIDELRAHLDQRS